MLLPQLVIEERDRLIANGAKVVPKLVDSVIRPDDYFRTIIKLVLEKECLKVSIKDINAGLKDATSSDYKFHNETRVAEKDRDYLKEFIDSRYPGVEYKVTWPIGKIKVAIVDFLSATTSVALNIRFKGDNPVEVTINGKIYKCRNLFDKSCSIHDSRAKYLSGPKGERLHIDVLKLLSL